MDMQSRYSGGAELYDAPMLVQRVEPGLKVTQSYTIGNDGARKDFEAEEYGVYSNAPEWYKMMQRDRVKPLFDNMKEDDAKKRNEASEKEETKKKDKAKKKKKKKKKKNKSKVKKKKKSTSKSTSSDVKQNGHTTGPTVQALTSRMIPETTATKQPAKDDFGATFEDNAKWFFL
ncbi:hypothetical protein PMZ80_004056 [Knufia obscura]|uniref:Uncharacterized protein n=1 Tax=Knufia obscura TaxID=1635080 RepID=A0ABR0RR27_9EURO|nr:hypothetical protein PMZ80_004056 [Knufia obscura]